MGNRLTVEANQCTQLVQPLLPLPVGCGRIKYLEFRIDEMKIDDKHHSMTFGLALPQLQGQWLGKVKNSACVNVSADLLLDGSLFPKALPIPIHPSRGHVIGIGLCYECHNDEQQMDCFFATVNGRLLCESRCMSASFRGFFLLTLFVQHVSMVLSVNRGDQPFLFDVAAFQRSHASPDNFYHSYLRVSDNLFNQHGEELFWTPSRMAEMFAYHEMYLPVGKAMESLLSDSYIHTVASCQRQLHHWQMLFRYIDEQLSILSPSNMPARLDSQVALDMSVRAAHFEPFVVDFEVGFPGIKHQIWKHLTDLRWNIQLAMIRAAIEHLQVRASLFDDQEELRGGSFEGWLKLAVFLSDTLDDPARKSDWLDFVRDSTLERLLESEFDIASSCPGYIIDDENDGAECGFDENEDEKAHRMLAIATTVNAWASWLGTFIAHLETLFSSPSPPPHLLSKVDRIIKDPTLIALSRAVVVQLPTYSSSSSPSPSSSSNAPSHAWMLLQYISLGFANGSSINHIPLTGREAHENLASYFDSNFQCLYSDADLAQIMEDAAKLLNAPHEGDVEELAYLKHQWQLATGEWPSYQLLAQSLLQQLPSTLVSTLNWKHKNLPEPSPHHTPAEIHNKETHHQDLPSPSTATKSRLSTLHNASKPPSPPPRVDEAQPSTWKMAIAAVGIAILSASIGAGLVLFLQTKRTQRGPKK